MAISSLSFLTAQQEVAGQLGLDYTDTNTLTRLKRWINLAYKDISGYCTWNWLRDRESVTMEVDITTGTVSVAAAGTTITFSSAPAATQAGKYIQFEGSDDWYKITAHTAAAATATISPGYIQTDALVAGTYIMRKMYYSLSSSVEYVESCRQATTNQKVEVVNARDYDDLGFPTDTASSVSAIVFWGADSSGNYTFTPFPIPSAVHLLEFRIIKAITELSGNTDTGIFPARFDAILLNRAKMYGFEFLNDNTMYTLKYNETQKQMEEMKKKDRVGKEELPVLNAVDSGRGNGGGIIQFPSTYGKV